jgi:hypothetical protein
MIMFVETQRIGTTFRALTGRLIASSAAAVTV